MQRKAAALRAVKEASAFLKKQFCTGHAGSKKADGTLVSAADHGSDARIIKILRKAFPDDAILTEESGELAGSNDYRWIVDPLDGTHNFLAGIPLFGILLALEKAGEIILSVCAFPLIEELFVAEKGKGAFLNGKRIHVSKERSLHGGMFLADGNSELRMDAIFKDIRPFRDHGCRFRMLGEGPFCWSRVAMGTAIAAVMHRGKIWDVAAPALLVEEAGGKVTDFRGKPWDLPPQSLVVTNGILHKKVLNILTS